MIQKTNAYLTSDGTPYAVLGEAQTHELAKLLTGDGGEVGGPATSLARKLVDQADKVVEILTLKPNSRPAARKPRKSKSAAKAAATAQTT